MKPILWIGSSVFFDDGPATMSAMPLAKRTTVRTTTNGPIARSSAGGGPFAV